MTGSSEVRPNNFVDSSIQKSIKYLARTDYTESVAREYEQTRQATFYGKLKWKTEIRAAARVIRNLPPQSILADIPAGTGRMLPLLHSNDFNPICMDVSKPMLEQAAFIRATAKTRMVQAEVEKIPLASKSVDYVLCLRLFQHIPCELAPAILGEMSRVARKGVILHIGIERPWSHLLFRLYRTIGMVKTNPHPFIPASPMSRNQFSRLVYSSGMVQKKSIKILPFSQARLALLEPLEETP